MKISFKILLIIVILILSLCFNIKAQDNGIKNFDVNKILSEMLIINKNSSKKIKNLNCLLFQQLFSLYLLKLLLELLC